MRLLCLLVLAGCHRVPAPSVAEAAVAWRAVHLDEDAERAFARAEQQLRVLEGMRIARGPMLQPSLVRYAEELEVVKTLYDEVARFRSVKWARAVLARLKYVNELARRTLEESER